MEVENVGNNPSEKPVNKRFWIIVFSAIGVVIVGLIIAIIVVSINRNSSEDPLAKDPSQAEDSGDGSENPDDSDEPSEEETLYQEISYTIRDALTEIDAEDSEQIFAIYKEHIDDTSDVRVKAMIEIDYYGVVMAYDENKERGNEVLDRLTKIDEGLKTISSAASVMNAADYYGNTDLYNQYNAILIDREKAAGIDLDMETEG